MKEQYRGGGGRENHEGIQPVGGGGLQAGIRGDGRAQLDDLVQAQTQAQEESEKVDTVAPDLSDGRGPSCTSVGHRWMHIWAEGLFPVRDSFCVKVAVRHNGLTWFYAWDGTSWCGGRVSPPISLFSKRKTQIPRTHCPKSSAKDFCRASLFISTWIAAHYTPAVSTPPPSQSPLFNCLFAVCFALFSLWFSLTRFSLGE